MNERELRKVDDHRGQFLYPSASAKMVNYDARRTSSRFERNRQKHLKSKFLKSYNWNFISVPYIVILMDETFQIFIAMHKKLNEMCISVNETKKLWSFWGRKFRLKDNSTKKWTSFKNHYFTLRTNCIFRKQKDFK